jgi:Ca2+-binding EF-hand superfamily protein
VGSGAAAAVPPGVRAAFEELDRDHSGRISQRELRAALPKLGLAVTADEATAVLRTFDADHDNLLDVHEFATLVVKLQDFQKAEAAKAERARILTPDVVAAFRRLDVDGSGGIDAREAVGALRELGVKANPDEAIAAVHRFDANKDGQLELEEWATLVDELRKFQARQGAAAK